jgi:hypothetical protein
MPSPFPGMDPYLEGYLWPDVHHRLTTQISDQLMPMLRPPYVARIEIQVIPDATPEADIGIMYPDVEVVRAHQHGHELPPASLSSTSPPSGAVRRLYNYPTGRGGGPPQARGEVPGKNVLYFSYPLIRKRVYGNRHYAA